MFALIVRGDTFIAVLDRAFRACPGSGMIFISLEAVTRCKSLCCRKGAATGEPCLDLPQGGGGLSMHYAIAITTGDET
jgi:hypothetical protein